MRRSSRTILLLLMFAFLLTSMGARGFNSKELVHNLDHHSRGNSVVLEHGHTVALSAGEKPKSEPLDEIAHELLHAVSALHFLASAAASSSWDASVRLLVPTSDSSSLSTTELESPFRPPRSFAFI
jgi:hypothetical protein